MTRMKPNPGSEEAVKRGCSCPRMDNSHGRGCGFTNPDGSPLFWIAQDCKLHAPKPN